jgi:hypothetical protein
MKTLLLASAILALTATGASAAGYVWPVAPSTTVPKPVTQPNPAPQPGGLLRLRRYPDGVGRSDDGSMNDTEMHTGLGDRTYQPCTFCGGVGH